MNTQASLSLSVCFSPKKRPSTRNSVPNTCECRATNSLKGEKEEKMRTSGFLLSSNNGEKIQRKKIPGASKQPLCGAVGSVFFLLFPSLLTHFFGLCVYRFFFPSCLPSFLPKHHFGGMGREHMKLGTNVPHSNKEKLRLTRLIIAQQKHPRTFFLNTG